MTREETEEERKKSRKHKEGLEAKRNALENKSHAAQKTIQKRKIIEK